MSEKVKGRAFVWRESIYKNNFICSCGYHCSRDGSGEPNDDVQVMIGKTDKEGLLFCPKCHNLIGRYFTLEIDEKELKNGNMLGNYDEYVRRKEMS